MAEKPKFDLKLIWYLIMIVVFVVINIPFGATRDDARRTDEPTIDAQEYLSQDSAMASKLRFSIQALERDTEIRPVVNEDWQNLLGRYIREGRLTETDAVAIYDYVQGILDETERR